MTRDEANTRIDEAWPDIRNMLVECLLNADNANNLDEYMKAGGDGELVGALARAMAPSMSAIAKLVMIMSEISRRKVDIAYKVTRRKDSDPQTRVQVDGETTYEVPYDE